MATIVQVNKRGSLTLPAEVRRNFNLQADAILMDGNTPEGILLRPARDAQADRFITGNAEIHDLFAGGGELVDNRIYLVVPDRTLIPAILCFYGFSCLPFFGAG